VSLRCYYAPAEPGYFGFTDSAYYEPERVPEWTPDAMPPIEPEPWPPRDYGEYVSRMYSADRYNAEPYRGESYHPDDDADMWLFEAERPRLEFLPSLRPTRPPAPSRREAISEPEYTKVSPPRCDDRHAMRPLAASIGQLLKELYFLAASYGTAGLEEYLDAIDLQCRLLRRLGQRELREFKTKLKRLAVENQNQLRLVDP
jgi:hypothetical protein